jgi:hypothetical protein
MSRFRCKDGIVVNPGTGMALDSEAAFASRLVYLVLATYRCALQALELLTAGSFTLSCSYSPGIDETLFVEIVVLLILGNAARPLEAGFESLHFGRFTLMVSETKQVIERSEDNAPRRLPPPEKEAPRLSQGGELDSLQLSGEYEFAYSRIDKVVLMLKDECELLRRRRKSHMVTLQWTVQACRLRVGAFTAKLSLCVLVSLQSGRVRIRQH